MGSDLDYSNPTQDLKLQVGLREVEGEHVIDLDIPLKIRRSKEPSSEREMVPSVLLVWPDRVKSGHPARVVLLIPDGLGLREHVIDVGNRLARRGFLVAIPDIFYRMGTELSFDVSQIDQALKAMDSVTEADVGLAVEQSVTAISEALDGEHRPIDTVLGFCFGGRIALVAAGMLGDRVDRVAMFYPNGLLEHYPGWSKRPIEFSNELESPVIGFFGGSDKYIPSDEVNEIEAYLDSSAELDTAVYLYPRLGHAFFDEGHINFDAPGSQDSWCRLLEFLEDGQCS